MLAVDTHDAGATCTDAREAMLLAMALVWKWAQCYDKRHGDPQDGHFPDPDFGIGVLACEHPSGAG